MKSIRIFSTKKHMIPKNKQPDMKKVSVPNQLNSIKSKKPIEVIRHCSQKGIEVRKQPKLK